MAAGDRSGCRAGSSAGGMHCLRKPRRAGGAMSSMRTCRPRRQPRPLSVACLCLSAPGSGFTRPAENAALVRCRRSRHPTTVGRNRLRRTRRSGRQIQPRGSGTPSAGMNIAPAGKSRSGHFCPRRSPRRPAGRPPGESCLGHRDALPRSAGPLPAIQRPQCDARPGSVYGSHGGRAGRSHNRWGQWTPARAARQRNGDWTRLLRRSISAFHADLRQSSRTSIVALPKFFQKEADHGLPV